MNKTEILKEYFGHSSFRDGQGELADGILSGRDVLGVMPTGAGKSVCYQVPALLFDGMTIVVSPLISLMKDQVSALRQAGVQAGYINSSLDAEQSRAVYRAAYAGGIKILYAAPERLATEGFINLCSQVKISLVAVDEAHCISQWGQDFRPSYLKIADFIDSLPERPVTAAFTATATEEVREDIKKLLRLKSPIEVTKGFDRKNLYFAVYKPKSKYDLLVKLLDKAPDKCTIIYCLTRKTVEDVCRKLCKNGFSATRYHAGLSDAERRKNQDDFIFDRKNIMVATNAFGMGIDKSNVGLVVHYNMPKNMESYYQEAGRAGRDGSDAECVLLYSGQDVRTNRFLIENSDENPELTREQRREVRKKDEERLDRMTAYCLYTHCFRRYILGYFGDTAPENCGNCSNCLSDFETVDMTIEAQKILSCVYRLKQRNIPFGKTMLTEVLRGSKTQRLAKYDFSDLSTYGIMSDSSEEAVGDMIDSLIGRGFLKQGGEYSLIDTTPESPALVRGKIKYMLKKRIKKAAPKPKANVYDIDYNLFSQLKTLRSEIAKRERVAAYIVFSDAALRDMCRKLPSTTEEFLEVAGVGRLKAKKYGDEFCACIKEYIEYNG
ncbi:MAG: DNA helicase RecQ [Firmicutes bacterium]|nr:DNA helicase RecQ [Bacillota bacterium]